jgi:hypothetical protein
MSKLVADLRAQIGEGLLRSAITLTSDWAMKYRVMGKPFEGPWSFDHHPWTKEIHDCTNEHICGQKAAQMGYSEAAINRAFKCIDIDRESVLYVLPTERPDAVDFSSSRFDPALEMSPHLRGLFSNTKNLGLKRAGNACLYIRSARSRSQLKSIPAGHLTFDEMDEMEKSAISLARERSSGQENKSEFDISTPTAPDFGINDIFKQSDQRAFIFKCPCCSRLTQLIFPDCMVITAERSHEHSIRDSYYICKECGGKLPHELKYQWLGPDNAYWEAMNKGSMIAGFHINQMYSFVIAPWEFAKNALDAQVSDVDEQEFYNSKLGQPHVVAGSSITDEDLKECEGGYEMARSVHSDNRLVTMGVDVGKKLHVEITEYLSDPDYKSTDVNLQAQARVIWAGTRDEFEELDQLMLQYKVCCCVIDLQPEQRKAKEFCRRWTGMAYTCTYGNAVSGRDIIEHQDFEDMRVTVDRTSWLDLSLGRFKRQAIKLPIDTSLEYKEQIQAPKRIYKKNSLGEAVGRYVESKDDHFAHARNYNEIAFRVATTFGGNTDIRGGM